MSCIVPFAGGVSTLGTYGNFSSGAVFLGISGTSEILIIILSAYISKFLKNKSTAHLYTKLTQKIHINVDEVPV